MSIAFDLIPSDSGYTVQVGFPSGSQKSIHFIVGEGPKEGFTLDLYSQNGEVDDVASLSFFTNIDVKGTKKAASHSTQFYPKASQAGFVLDLKDGSGFYGDVEAIRQS